MEDNQLRQAGNKGSAGTRAARTARGDRGDEAASRRWWKPRPKPAVEEQLRVARDSAPNCSVTSTRSSSSVEAPRRPSDGDAAARGRRRRHRPPRSQKPPCSGKSKNIGNRGDAGGNRTCATRPAARNNMPSTPPSSKASERWRRIRALQWQRLGPDVILQFFVLTHFTCRKLTPARIKIRADFERYGAARLSLDTEALHFRNHSFMTVIIAVPGRRG